MKDPFVARAKALMQAFSNNQISRKELTEELRKLKGEVEQHLGKMEAKNPFPDITPEQAERMMKDAVETADPDFLEVEGELENMDATADFEAESPETPSGSFQNSKGKLKVRPVSPDQILDLTIEVNKEQDVNDFINSL